VLFVSIFNCYYFFYRQNDIAEKLATQEQSNDIKKMLTTQEQKLATQEQLIQGLQNQIQEQQKLLLRFMERLEPHIGQHIPQIAEKEKSKDSNDGAVDSND
jgi:hypothetical protein